MPGVPIRAARPATAALTASVDRAGAPASDHRPPAKAPSRLPATRAPTAPTAAAAVISVTTARPPRSPSSVTTAPAAMPASVMGSTLDVRTAPRGSSAAAGTTSTLSIGAPPSCRATARWSDCATSGLAAEAVSSLDPRSVTTTAPYTVRSSTASRAAASSA
ncbi:hypothetical protein QFZ75_006737 [Streptomyces sp. V3I8]|nr:hypothetical protein [Streptomyces sp. V3I8]